ncbi:MAG: DUF6049 family protein [Terracoccus sp.]
MRRRRVRPRPATALLRSTLGLAVAVVTAASVLVPATGATAARAQTGVAAAVDSTPVLAADVTAASVVLTSVTPSVVRPGDAVTITGTVTAPSSEPLTTPVVAVVLGADDLSSRASIDAWADGSGAARGRSLTTVTLPTVASGASTTFVAAVPAGGVRSGKAFTALPISVEVRPAGADTPTGATRSFLAWHARKEYEPLRVATLLPVTLDPVMDLFDSDAAARDAAWTAVIGPESRVQRILDGTRGTPVALAVDPAVLGPDPVRADVQAPEVSPSPTSSPSPAPTATTPSATTTSPSATPPASTDPATPSSTPTPTATATQTAPPIATGTPGGGPAQTPAISALAGELAAGLTGRTLWALPYADADLAATVDSSPGNTLVRDLVSRRTTLSSVLGVPVRDDVAWPVDGLLPPGRETGLTTAYAATPADPLAGIVVDQSAVTTTGAYTPTARRVASGGTRLIASDARLSALLPTRSEPNAVLATQRYLAESLALLGERPGTPRAVLVTASRTYDPDATELAAFLAATATAPWIERVDPGSLLQDSGSDRAVAAMTPRRAPTSSVPPPTLTSRRLDDLAHEQRTIADVATVLRDGDQFAATYGELLDELTSARWRYRPASWVELNATVTADTRAATSAIKVVGRSVNFLAESGTLQVTVENGLDYTVEDIRLRLVPTNPRMQVDEQPGPISIGPSSKRVVPVAVTAVAAGQVNIRAYLTTADGTPIGSPTVIPVSANPIDGAIYWVGGALVGLVLLIGLARTLLRGTPRIDEIGDIATLSARHTTSGPEQR